MNISGELHPAFDGGKTDVCRVQSLTSASLMGNFVMSVAIDLVYEGELRCQATHGPSGVKLTTDAPVDNHGRGESFSPTDLVATALGGCLMTIMGIVAQRSQIDLTGTRIHVDKEMIQQPVRRIGRLTVRIEIPSDKAALVSPADRAKLETAALHCPVHKSLHPDIETPVEFLWGSSAN